MDKTLVRQLIRIFGSMDNIPPECKNLVEIVNKTYFDFQDEYKLIERSLDISSSELTELNQRLREEIDVKNQLTDRLQREAEIIEETVQIRTKELNLERVKLEKITQNMETGAVLIDRSGKVIFLNEIAQKIISFYEETYDNFLEKLYDTFTDCPIAEYVDRGLKGETLKIDNIKIAGAIYHILFQHIPKEDEYIGLLIWIDDVTEEKLLERAKSELVAVASHQLRTPLTITKGNTEILLDESYGPLTDEQKKIITQTHISNENMIALVNNMLDINKIEQGDFSFKLIELDALNVLKETIKNLTTFATSKSVDLKYTPLETEPIYILGDETRLYQVFQNIIDNAVKYSSRYTKVKQEKPKVTISTEIVGDNLVIKIQDEGIGIPKSEHTKIFGRFFRASNAEQLFIDGTGLGLHMVKSIIESSNGHINFESTENQGTTFTLTFPIVKKELNN